MRLPLEGVGRGREPPRPPGALPPPTPWYAVCEDLASALATGPIRDIQRNVGLSEPQRVAFYELVTASLRAADRLGSACPAETALTPVGGMTSLRARLAAVCGSTAAIRPALTRF
jgi:hypothetical protein